MAETLRTIGDDEDVAYLQTTAREFQIVKGELGYLTVNIEDISPYANGSRVVLKLGNPSSATLRELSATLEWGRIDAQGSPSGRVYSKQQSFPDPLAGGTWRQYVVTLADVPPQELGYIRVKDVDLKSISLAMTN
jgi:hypothetical protein